MSRIEAVMPRLTDKQFKYAYIHPHRKMKMLAKIIFKNKLTRSTEVANYINCRMSSYLYKLFIEKLR